VKIDPSLELTSEKVSVKEKEKERKVPTTEDFHSAASATFAPQLRFIVLS